MKCSKCENGALGPVGHVDLFIVRLDSTSMQFKCAACGTLWTRPTKAQAPIIWNTSVAEVRGMTVPGWKARRHGED